MFIKWFHSNENRSEQLAFCGAIIVAGLLISAVYLFTLRLDNLDHRIFISQWVGSLDTDGLAVVLEERVANYTAPYVVVLSLVNAWLPDAPTLTVMHATGLVLHLFLAAVLIYFVTQTSHTVGIFTAVLMAALTPTSIVNGVVWGQSDSFFTGFVLIAMLSVIKKHWILGFLTFSAALSIKLVAVFAAPAFLILIVRANASRQLIWLPLVLPATYLFMNLPYLLAGVPVDEVLTIYADQAATYEALSLNAPNFWYILQTHPITKSFAEEWLNHLTILGLALGALSGIILCIAGIRGTVSNLNAVDQIWLLAVSSILFPSLLAKMHDRYFFLADVTLWLLAIIDRRFLFPAIMAQLGSLVAYVTFLDIVPQRIPISGAYLTSLGAVFIATAAMSLFWIGWRNGNFHRIFYRAPYKQLRATD